MVTRSVLFKKRHVISPHIGNDASFILGAMYCAPTFILSHIIMSKNIIAVGNKTNTKLQSKVQKQFNTLIKKIEKQRKELSELQDSIVPFQQRIDKELKPIKNKFDTKRADLVRLWHKHIQSGFFSKKEREKMIWLLKNIAEELLHTGKHDELKEIYDQYSETSFDEQAKAERDAEKEDFLSMLRNEAGIDLSDLDLNLDEQENPEQTMQEIMRRLEARQAEVEAEELAKAEAKARKKAENPKTAKQLAQEAKQREKEAKKQETAQSMSKSVKEIYMSLVKAFHPDREPDEAERVRKTEIMQEVTAAYEKNDLLALLELQLKFEQIDQKQLDNIAEDRLKHYIEVLKQQSQQLEQEKEQQEEKIRMIFGLGWFQQISVFALNQSLSQDIKAIATQSKKINNDLKYFEQPNEVRRFLRDFEIPLEHSFADFLEDFGDLLGDDDDDDDDEDMFIPPELLDEIERMMSGKRRAKGGKKRR